MSISNISNIKSKLITWFKNHLWIMSILVLVLLLTLSFGFGYLVAKETNPAPIIIEKHFPDESAGR